MQTTFTYKKKEFIITVGPSHKELTPELSNEFTSILDNYDVDKALSINGVVNMVRTDEAVSKELKAVLDSGYAWNEVK